MTTPERGNPFKILGAKAASITLLFLAALVRPVAALSPPAPPEPTIRDVIQRSQTVFIGKVISTRWLPIRPDSTSAGSVALEVQVTKVLWGDARAIPEKVIYAAGRQNLTETQAREAYDDKSFVFAGRVNQRLNAPTEVWLPPGARPPFELSTLADFDREIESIKEAGGRRNDRTPKNR